MKTPLLEIRGLTTRLFTAEGTVRAVEGLSLHLFQGETLALVGESGCGKTMAALSVMRLLPETGRIVGGSVRLRDLELLALSEREMRKIRGRRLAMIFQEPMLSLNPVMTVGDQLTEALRLHFSLSRKEARERVLATLQAVGIPEAKKRMEDYPFQFSGGMKQRIMTAMALIGEPDLLIADEPTTALDVTIQAQILELLRRIREERHMAMFLITHDLGVVAETADRVAVMYAGEIVETATKPAFFSSPAHPYSQRLFASLPRREKRGRPLAVMPGGVPSLDRVFSGCPFADRCHVRLPHCLDERPSWTVVAPGHEVRCHRFISKGKEGSDQGAPLDLSEETVSGDKTYAVKGPGEERKDQGRPLLEVSGLRVYFPIRKGLFKRTVGWIKAVDDVSLTVYAGKTLALVGESGCGKTTLGKGILRLLPLAGGRITFQGTDVTSLSRRRLRPLRKEFQVIFQDPYASLNPRMRVLEILEEGMAALNIGGGKNERLARMDRLLEETGLPPESKFRYPHEFSGGQRQRIAIARALSVEPVLVICDEPTSALDISVQAQILNLMKELQNRRRLAYLFITHNLSVVEYLAHEVAVMYLGRIVEQGETEPLLERPAHPYTRALLSAVPVLDPKKGKELIRLEGDIPSPADPPRGCHFHPRCPQAMPRCRETYPQAVFLGSGHSVRCHLYD